MALNQLIVLNIIKYKYCVNKSRDMSRDHFVPFCTPKSICQVLKSPLALDIWAKANKIGKFNKDNAFVQHFVI